MVAVQELILKTTKLKPVNLTWDGNSDTLATFLELVEDWIDVRFGEDAVRVLKGDREDEHGTKYLAPCVYTAWSHDSAPPAPWRDKP